MRIVGRLSARAALMALLLLATLSLATYLLRAARMTMLNTGIAIDCSPTSAALLFAGAAALVLPGLLARGAAVRVTAFALALGVAALGVDCLTFRVTAERDTLRVHRFAHDAILPWTQVAKVEHEPDGLVFVDLSGRQLRLDLSGLTAGQRAAFDRTLARRIWESGPARAAQ